MTRLRIGELARRTGVSETTLRAWERRYGLLRPDRTDGGFRVYGETDVARVEAMQHHLASGVAAAEAAALALETPERDAAPVVVQVAAALVDAATRLDESDANRALDRALATLTVETAVRDVFFPALRAVAAEWRNDERAIASEHFATNLIRGRLLALARGWDRGMGPHALLACAPEEQHDLALLVLGLALRERGWRITYLGTRTPLATVAASAALLDVDLVVVSATSSDRLARSKDDLRALARDERLALGGPGATDELARDVGAELLADDPYAAAEALA